MATCSLCGRRNVDPSNHGLRHASQLRRDHTGPHGRCGLDKLFAECDCPDAVVSSGAWRCTCCLGALDYLEHDPPGTTFPP